MIYPQYQTPAKAVNGTAEKPAPEKVEKTPAAGPKKGVPEPEEKPATVGLKSRTKPEEEKPAETKLGLKKALKKVELLWLPVLTLTLPYT